MKNSYIRLSIIIPCYNCEKYIEDCVKSIISNCYDDTEILLINDGSSDNTLNVLYQLEKNYNNIKVFNKDNSGVSSTRNYGIKNSSGTYISFVDSDDYVINNMFKNMVDKFEECDVDIVCCDYLELSNNKFSNSKFNYKDGKFDSVYITKLFLEGKISISVWDKMYKKSILNSILFNEHLSVGEDSLFCLQSFECSQNIYMFHDAFYIYKQNDNSAVHSVSKKLLEISSLDNYIPQTIKEKYVNEYNYFISDCMLRCIHILSVNCCTDNKKIVSSYIKQIYSRKKAKNIITSRNSSIYSKVEMFIMYLFGINAHLFLFKFYKIARELVRK